MMYFLIASVFINGAAEASHFKCSTAPSNTIANEMGFESTGSLAVYYTWNNGKVPYFFTNGVTQQDRIFVKEQMQLIESKTCVRFIEGSHFSDEIHHMEIDVEPRSCGESSSQGFGTTFSAFVEPQQGLKVLFKSHYQFADKHFCRGNNTIISGGVIHELFHALGAIHTHQREDKEKYVTYNKRCLIHPDYDDQFTIEDFPIPTDTEDIKYEFNSIMHYNCDTWSWCKGGGCQCNTLQPKDGTSCSVLESNIPTEMDWKMIRQYHCGGDSGASSTTTATTTTATLTATTTTTITTTTTTTTTTTAATTTTTSFGPSDIFDWEICAQWKGRGLCWEDAEVRYLCAATCGGDRGTSSTTAATSTTTTTTTTTTATSTTTTTTTQEKVTKYTKRKKNTGKRKERSYS